ncbi:MAG: Cytidyltransferase-related enzyme [Parcubacteria group bacterium GW2011_GWA2_37_10]|nr:MAG: Cytidyltransferase-related enzyme [Parcubacteria group bacterium GW2011_GWA2_37_10]
MKKIVIVSGYFNPLHIGHVHYIEGAKKLGDFLIAIVNNDEQVKIKGSMPFLSENERVEIVKSIKYVDVVYLSIDKDETVSKSLEAVAEKYPGQLILARGAGRNADNVSESEKQFCKKFNIETIYGVGGEKIQNSSWLLKKVIKENS